MAKLSQQQVFDLYHSGKYNLDSTVGALSARYELPQDVYNQLQGFHNQVLANRQIVDIANGDENNRSLYKQDDGYTSPYMQALNAGQPVSIYDIGVTNKSLDEIKGFAGINGIAGMADRSNALVNGLVNGANMVTNEAINYAHAGYTDVDDLISQVRRGELSEAEYHEQAKQRGIDYNMAESHLRRNVDGTFLSKTLDATHDFIDDIDYANPLISARVNQNWQNAKDEGAWAMAKALPSFAMENLPSSGVDMAAMAYVPSIYAVARFGEGATANAENDGMDVPDMQSLLNSGVQTAFSLAIDKAGINLLSKAQGLKGVAGSVVSEGATEGIQEAIEYQGSVHNTKTAFDWGEAGSRAFDGTVLGGFTGGIANAGVQLLSRNGDRQTDQIDTTGVTSSHDQAQQAGTQPSTQPSITAPQTTTPVSQPVTTNQYSTENLPVFSADQLNQLAQTKPRLAERIGNMQNIINNPNIDDAQKANVAQKLVQVANDNNLTTATQIGQPQQTENIVDTTELVEDIQQVAEIPKSTANEKIGSQSYISINNNREPTRLKVVEAGSLSPDTAGTTNQFRDRNRKASLVQIDKMANNLDPRRLIDTATLDTGSPTLANDGKTIIAGNGRTQAIKRAYALGKASEYKQTLIDNAQAYGINPQEVSQMQNPVLVRQFENDVDVQKLAIASNETAGLAMSAMEQARADSTRLENIPQFIANNNGDINHAGNRGAIKQFVSAMPIEAQAGMVGADGMLSQEGVRRINNAVLYKAYGDSKALSDMIENPSPDMRNAIKGMVNVATQVANTKDGIEQGVLNDVDISDDITNALAKLQQLRHNNMTVSDYLAQRGMFEEDLSPVARELVQYIDSNIRSAKKITQLLSAYYDNIEALGNPNQADIFGDTPQVSREELFNRTLAEVKNEQQANRPTSQTDIFNQSEPTSNQSEPTGQLGQTVSVDEQSEQRQSNETGIGADEKPAVETEPTAQDGGFSLDDGRQDDDVKHSQSAMKSVQANIKRGKQAMNKAIAEKADVNRAMYRNDIGWIDFVWGDDKKGIQHIIKRRQETDDMSYDEAVEFLSEEVPSIIAKGVKHRNITDKTGKSRQLQIRHSGKQVNLVKNKGSNAWVLTGYSLDGKKDKKADDVRAVGFDTNKTTQSKPTPTRQELGASTENSVPQLAKQNQTSPQQLANTKAMLEKAIGKNRADKITIHTIAPNDNVQHSEGYHNRTTGETAIILDNIEAFNDSNGNTILTKEERAVWVAWHEAFHRGMSIMGDDLYKEALRKAKLNSTVVKLAKEIQNRNPNYSDDIALEEALAEIRATLDTGNFEVLESQYGVKFPKGKSGMRKAVSNWVNTIRRLINKLMGREVKVSDQEIIDLIQSISGKDSQAYSDNNTNTLDEKRFSTPTPESEINAVRAQYKDTDQWLKAPNGKPTNLTEKQWLQVRTPSFKNWFGDWEKSARIEKLRNSKDVVIDGNGYQGKYELDYQSARAWIKENLRNKNLPIDDTGEVVIIEGDGANKVTTHNQDSQPHLKSIVAIPDMLKNAIFITQEKANKDKKYDDYRYYVTGVVIDNESYTAKIVVGVDSQGNKFYDHQLTQIEKTKLIDHIDQSASGFKLVEDLPLPPDANIKDTRLTQILQVNSSKVIDENGEPLVVYHGTSADFTTFNKTQISDRGWYGEGYYFTQDKDYATFYGQPKHYFLNIKNPRSDYNVEQLPTNNEESTAFTQENKASGYDGFFVYRGQNTDGSFDSTLEEAVAFNPNQIKSATNNNGRFDPNNNDIRYSFAGQNANTANIATLEQAKQMQQDGATNEQTRVETGWFKGVDGKWRFEIDDSKSALTFDVLSMKRIGMNQTYKLSDIYKHNQLYEAYPELTDLKIRLSTERNKPSVEGSYRPNKTHDFMADIEVVYQPTKITDKQKTHDEIKSVITHELQHVIQETEGFAKGSSVGKVNTEAGNQFNSNADRYQEAFIKREEEIKSSKAYQQLENQENAILEQLERSNFGKGGKLWDDLTEINHKKEEMINNDSQLQSYKKKRDDFREKALKEIAPYWHYRKQAGEVEARNTEARLNMTSDERRNTPIEQTEDVARSDQLVGFESVQADSLNEDSNSAFAKAVDGVVKGHIERGYVNMGTTPKVLVELGLPDTKVRIHGAVIEKIMGEYLGITKGKHKNIHNLTPDTAKKLPMQLNDPVAVFKSKTVEDAYIVLTELNEVDTRNGSDKPVIASLYVKGRGEKLDVVNITSAYGRSDSQLKKAFTSDAVYINTKKAQNLNTERLQLPWDITSEDELSKRNIKTETDLSQYQDTQIRHSKKPKVKPKAMTPRPVGMEVPKQQRLKDEFKNIWNDDTGKLDKTQRTIKMGIERQANNSLENIKNEINDKMFDQMGELERIDKTYGGKAKTLHDKFRMVNGKINAEIEGVLDPRILSMTKMMADKYQEVKDKYYGNDPKYGKAQFLLDLNNIGQFVMHGKERNLTVFINSKGEDTAGSGRTDEEIDNFTAWYQDNMPDMIDFYKSLYRQEIKPVIDFRQQKLLENGLLTQEQIDAQYDWEWYVPLKGEQQEVVTDPVTGKVLTDTERLEKSFFGDYSRLGNKEIPKMKGRHGTQAESIFGSIFTDAQIAIQRSHLQDPKQALLEFAQTDEGKQSLGARITRKVDTKQFTVDKDGKLKITDNKINKDENTVVYRDGNVEWLIEIKNKKALTAMKGVTHSFGDGTGGAFLQMLSRVTRANSSVWTRFNLAFQLVNKLRDTFSQYVLILADSSIGKEAGAGIEGYKQAIRNLKTRLVVANQAVKYNTAFTASIGSKIADKPSENFKEYQYWLEKYRKEGGVTTYSQLLGKDKLASIEREFSKAVGVRNSHGADKVSVATKKMTDKTVAFFDGVGDHMELSSRVALFKALVEAGVSETDSAIYTKNTMNFETKGEWGRFLGSFYAFSTAIIFDSKRALSAMLKTKEGHIMFVTLFVGKMIEMALSDLFSDDDEDGISYVDKIPFYQAMGYTNIFFGDRGEGIKIPKGFGLSRVAGGSAVIARRMMNGRMSFGEGLSTLAMDVVMGSFSPVQIKQVEGDFANKVIQTATPTFALPIVQLGSNTSFTGSSIYADFKKKGQMDYESGFSWTDDHYKLMAKMLYNTTGVDVHPETIKLQLRAYIPMAIEAGQAAEGVVDAHYGNTDTKSTINKIPVISKFTFAPPRYEQRLYRQRKEQIKAWETEMLSAQNNGDMETYQQYKDKGVDKLVNGFKIVDKSISRIKDQADRARETLEGDALRKRLIELEDDEKRVTQTLNRKYEEIT